MDVTKVDLARCETVAKALKRGKFELVGEEILAFAQAWQWLGEHYEKLKAEVALKAAPPPAEESTKKKKG